ncbi:MAG TPA: hypothetical protein VJT09_16980 [Pyrinomonadaceae bacterium]|nr:hypothetical protein [Pyrinomonadaceae bacterium]
MPQDRTRRSKLSVLAADRESLTALDNVSNYPRVNPAYAVIAR